MYFSAYMNDMNDSEWFFFAISSGTAPDMVAEGQKSNLWAPNMSLHTKNVHVNLIIVKQFIHLFGVCFYVFFMVFFFF